MLTILGLLFLAAILLALILAAMKPDTFRVTRAIVINEPSETIFPFFNDLENFRRWSPYEKLDPDMQRTISAPASGVGASYAWDSKGKAGAGKMTIKKSIPSSTVEMALEFVKPFKSSSTATFSLEPQGAGTRVTWEMAGPAPFVSKIMQVFFNMDKMIGKDFEQGLADLKAVTETGAVR